MGGTVELSQKTNIQQKNDKDEEENLEEEDE
jgi:hypothetical protein